MRKAKGVNEAVEEDSRGGRREGFARGTSNDIVRFMKPVVTPEILENPLFVELMKEGLAIQDQFSAEPVYARTGKGYLKPTGVAELEKIKEAKRAKRS